MTNVATPAVVLLPGIDGTGKFFGEFAECPS
jgi:hypothetical protein